MRSSSHHVSPVSVFTSGFWASSGAPLPCLPPSDRLRPPAKPSERLASSGAEPVARRQHAVHYLAQAERAAGQLYTWHQRAWLDRLTIEQRTCVPRCPQHHHRRHRVCLESVAASTGAHQEIGLGDYLIGATADVEGLELATLNVRRFPMIKDLQAPFRA
jgi:predicted nucleic acid-binding protein